MKNIITLAFITGVILIACKNVNQINTSAIKPLFNNFNIEYQDYNLLAEKGDTLLVGNGTRIIIPENAFIDNKGNKIEGEVQIKYREFQDALDIVISGIPMSYDSGGVSNSFETGGMFEINGFSNGIPVYVAKNKSLQIDFSSETEGDFNFYKFDSLDNNWSFTTGNLSTQINPVWDSLNNKLGEMPEKPIIPEIVDKNTQILDLNVNYSLFPELKAIEGLMWKYSGNDEKTNPENNKWIYTEPWYSIEIKKHKEESNQFELQLISKNKDFATLITPVLIQSHYNVYKDLFDDKMKEYANLKKQYEDKQNEMNIQNEFIRTFNINGFGIYNCDRIYSSPNMIVLNSNFLINGNPIDFNSVTHIYHITAQNKALIEYYSSNINNLKIDPYDDNEILIVFKDNSVASFNKNKFNELNLLNIGASSRSKKVNVTLDFGLVTQKISSKEDIENIIANI